MSSRLDVRCCCNPGKLIGSMPWPDDDREQVFYFNSRAPILWHEANKTSAPAYKDFSRIVLEKALISVHGKTSYAIKDNGATLDQLKQIPGFIPV